MIRTHENLEITAYDKPRNNTVQGGYKYLISNKSAFKTDKGFQDWLQRSNIKLQFIATRYAKEGEENVKIHTYATEGIIEEKMFWKQEELPENAIQYKDLCNGSIVDCYYIHTENGSQIYKPNPNAKEVYKPLPIDEQIEFIIKNG